MNERFFLQFQKMFFHQQQAVDNFPSLTNLVVNHKALPISAGATIYLNNRLIIFRNWLRSQFPLCFHILPADASQTLVLDFLKTSLPKAATQEALAFEFIGFLATKIAQPLGELSLYDWVNEAISNGIPIEACLPNDFTNSRISLRREGCILHCRHPLLNWLNELHAGNGKDLTSLLQLPHAKQDILITRECNKLTIETLP